MATMATGHGLSVITNSCIKNPRNPSSGLSYTVNERPVLPCDARLYAQYAEELAEAVRHCSPEQVSTGTKEIQDYSEELSNLPDDEFYRKLIQLKNEQKKTLTVCERLYASKLNAEETYKNLNHSKSFDTLHGAVQGDSTYQDVEQTFTPIMSNHLVPDRILDMSLKPPSGRSPQNTHEISYNSRVNPYSAAIRSRSPDRLHQPRPSSAPVTSNRRNRSLSLDGSIHVDISQELAQNGEMLSTSDQHSKALAKLDDMWERFSIDDYAPPRRPSSALSNRSTESDGGWRHRITIPKPFKMTLRESLKEKKKSKACIELEKQREEKNKAEEEELQRKFKASPLPAHIYLPLYDELNERSEAKRHYAQQYSKEILESKVKPFKFSQREESGRKHKRCNSAPVLIRKEKFRAKDVPESVYDKSVTDRMMEEEEYRKIRIKLRSKNLLRMSSLPPGMEAREKAQAKKMKEKALQERKKPKKLRVSRDVPDYDALYRQFQQELSRRKYGRESTVAKPFNLHSNQLSSSREKILQDMERDEEILRENRWPYQSSRITPRRALGSLSASLDAIPYKSTNSQDLRSSTNRQKVDSLTNQEREEIEQDRQRRVKSMKLRKSILKKSSDVPNPRDSIAERIKQMKRSDRSRLDDYDLELEEIRRRVADRPLLVERQSEKNAKRQAEKKFLNKIQSVGLDEDFIQSRSSRAGSFHTGSEGFENYEEHDVQPSPMTLMDEENIQDTTYVKDSEEIDDTEQAEQDFE